MYSCFLLVLSAVTSLLSLPQGSLHTPDIRQITAPDRMRRAGSEPSVTVSLLLVARVSLLYVNTLHLREIHFSRGEMLCDHVSTKEKIENTVVIKRT